MDQAQIFRVYSKDALKLAPKIPDESQFIWPSNEFDKIGILGTNPIFAKESRFDFHVILNLSTSLFFLVKLDDDRSGALLGFKFLVDPVKCKSVWDFESLSDPLKQKRSWSQ